MNLSSFQSCAPKRTSASFCSALETNADPLVIEKRSTPKAVLLSVRDYVKLAATEPEVLRVLGEESRRNGTDAISSRQIDANIRAARARKKK
jgi:PHD/YefM family antitoxin component YafN of YafNO toxin-antitoxin module